MRSRRRRAEDVLKPGQYYEDCAYHPCLCIRAEGELVYGVSLVDGSNPRTCDINHCGVFRLTFRQAMDRKFYGPPDPEDAARIPEKERWWVVWRGSPSHPSYGIWPEPRRRARRR